MLICAGGGGRGGRGGGGVPRACACLCVPVPARRVRACMCACVRACARACCAMLTPLSPSSDVIAPIIPGRFWLMRQRRVCWLESGASAVLGKLTELVTAPSSRKRASCAAAIASLLSVASLVASPSAGMHTKLGWSCMYASAWSLMYLPRSSPASYLVRGRSGG